ncbi:MAG: excinuclease ABC subunit C [Bacteroidales bacterium 36-12]|nr:MAG: excinuclease ABC subunit C [Bacteroidales bacterium 36-12]
MNISNELLSQIKTLPDKPGVYQYFNSKGEIIYVGKAKNLKKRVSSYFNKNHDSNKTYVLVKNIATLNYIVVDTEADALLLENNLIKEYQPRYNVMLKDDKTYPSIRITNEPFPRIFKTRTIVKDGSKYYGPYTSVHALNTLLDLIHEILPIRTCRLDLSDSKIRANNYKLCLQYYIKRCNGPCEGLETEEEYRKHIDAAEKIIKGNANEISKMLLEEIKRLADEYKFEEANLVKMKYELLESFKSKSIIANSVVDETDIFSYDEDEKSSYVNFLQVSNGSIIKGYTIEYKKRTEERKEDILSMAIIDLRTKFGSNSKEIIVPFDIEFPIEGVKTTIPKIGDKKKLLDLSVQNVKQFKLDKLKQSEKLNPEQKSIALLKAIQEKLKLDKIPMTIECFDNSNISGSNAVAACVVFVKGKPSKKDYRKYNIKTVDGPDDYASMREIVYRRYSRMLKEETHLPDLILVDGGIGHMESVRQVIEDELNIQIPIAGLSKNDKHRTNELLFGFPPKVIGMKVNDQLFKLLANIQEEVHRFAITFHRDKRSKTQTTSELDKINGIGEKTKFELINHFKSIKRIRMAQLSEIEKIIGKHRASIVYTHFNKELKL